MANFYENNNYAQREGAAGFKFDTVGPYTDTNGSGQVSRLSSSVFSGGPFVNQAAPGTALVNLWSMPLAAGALNVQNRSMRVTAVGYLTTDATSAKGTFQLLLGTIPLFTWQTAATVILASQTACMWEIDVLSQVTTPGTPSAIETHGTLSYVSATANTLVTEGDHGLVSGNIAPDLTQANTLYLTFQASAAHVTNVQAKNVLVELLN